MNVRELSVPLNLSLPDFIICSTTENHESRAKTNLIMKFVALFAKNNTTILFEVYLHQKSS